MAIQKIIYNGEELCTALGINRITLDKLEHSADPLPFFTIPGSFEHLYPLSAVSEWAARQCDRQQGAENQN